MHDILNEYVIQVLFSLALAALTALLGVAVRWLNARVRWANAETKARDLGIVEAVAHAAVQAVEQLARSRSWDPKLKKAQAEQRIIAIAESQGVTVTPVQLDTYVEQAVKALKDASAALTVTAEAPASQAEVAAEPPAVAVTVTAAPKRRSRAKAATPPA